jgi:hypothetical protein
LNTLGKMVGTKVVQVKRDAWDFTGTFSGRGEIFPYPADAHSLVIYVDKKPWYVPDCLIDYCFKTSLV